MSYKKIRKHGMGAVKPFVWVLLGVGVLLTGIGISAMNSASSDLSYLYGGAPAERALWQLLAGMVISFAGLAGLLPAFRKNKRRLDYSGYGDDAPLEAPAVAKSFRRLVSRSASRVNVEKPAVGADGEHEDAGTRPREQALADSASSALHASSARP